MTSSCRPMQEMTAKQNHWHTLCGSSVKTSECNLESKSVPRSSCNVVRSSIVKELSYQMPETTPATAPSPWGTWTPSNTSMPGCTPLTTPNDSSIGSRTSAQLRNKGPICYNEMSQIHPENCPFPVDNRHQNLINSFLDRPLSPPQMASGSNQPFCHNSLCADRPTNRWPIQMFGSMSRRRLLDDSDVANNNNTVSI